jgi:hypothetical protein
MPENPIATSKSESKVRPAASVARVSLRPCAPACAGATRDQTVRVRRLPQSLGVRALSRSHFSRGARTCSTSTIGFELKWT